MTVKNITGTPYYTVDDIQRPELKEYLEQDSSLGSLAQAGYTMAEYLSTLTIDPETRAGLDDLVVIFSIMRSKALEVRMLTAQLKNALNYQLEK